MLIHRTILTLVTVCMMPAGLALAAAPSDQNNQNPAEPAESKPAESMAKNGRATGLEIPRFVSLKSSRARVRRGPGRTFPIDWVYVRRDMPVEIIDEWELWRRIRDIDGSRGWIHKQLLDGRRHAMITDLAELSDIPGNSQKIIAHLEGGVVARLNKCQLDWCQVKTGALAGWLPKTVLWGVYNDEIFE